MSPPTDPEHFDDVVTLSPPDAAVLDALLGARAMGSEAGPMPAGSGERAEAMRRLLGLLDQDQVLDSGASSGGNETNGGALVSATLARVAAARAKETQAVEVTPLCEADGEALDAVLAAGGQVGPVPPGSSERVAKVRDVLSVLDQLPRPGSETAGETSGGGEDSGGGGDSGGLVRRTLDAVAEQRRRERFAQQVEMYAQPRRTLGVGWTQVATAAAVLLVGISLLMPAIDRSRQHSQQVACATNLGIAGQQMNAFAVDHAGMLPRGPVGESWLKAGQADAVDDAGRYQSNSAHLFLLIREGYVAPQRLACASNADASAPALGSGQLDWDTPAAISYSYQNQHGESPIRIDRSRAQLAVLADKSPLFVADDGQLVFNADAARDARTLLHRGNAQNVLTLDNRVVWTAEPVVDGDNVWQIDGFTGAYTGTETPADAQRDSFLVP